ncbi:MAG: ABC transporter substrate-binding protein [Candidatus Rokuibacteriota bacterium]
MTRREATQRPLGRPTRLASALVLAAVLGLTSHDAPAQQKPVVVVQSGEAATLDWHMHCDKNAHEPDRQIFDTLLRRNLKTLQLEGNLAESWRLLNDTTWQFKLRRGVKFHNDEPFDASAVKFSVERMLNPQQAAPGRTSIATIDRVEIVDPLTVNVITKTPFPLLPVRMSPGHCGTVGIVPPKYVAQVGDAGFAVKPVGTGPYKLVEWVKDDRLVLEANKDYHRGAPAIDRLVFRPVPELTTRVAALLSGQADLVSDVPPDQVGKVKASGVARIEVSTLGGFIIMMKITNYLMPGPWQDVRVRKAINHAIDMDTIIKTVLEGYGQVLGVPLEKEAFGFNPNITWYGYDPERAKALLREAGHPNGFEMTLHVPNRRYMNDIEVVQAMAQMLAKVGIKAKVEVGEQSVYTTKWRRRELLPVYMTAWGGAGIFDGDLLVNSLHSKSALAIHKNEALDKILEDAQGSNDPEKRKALYWKAQEMIYEDAPIIKAYQQAHIFGISNRLDWTPWIDNMLFLYDAKVK